MELENKTTDIIKIWDSYISNKTIVDTKGVEIEDIDGKRKKAIIEVQDILSKFLSGENNIFEFKSALDSYNKKNNLWGFTATKGQMFFNQLVKGNEENIDEVTSILQDLITEPKNLDDALGRIESLELFVQKDFDNAADKRKVANPKSISYFLSYFWQIYDNQKWPIAYSSLINSFTELELWEEKSSQKENYLTFFKLNDDIKQLVNKQKSLKISNWDLEHAFWAYSGNPNKPSKPPVKKEIKDETFDEIIINPSIDLNDYIIPKVTRLIEIGEQTEGSGTAKGVEFERLVAEVFKQLDFEVEVLGQGKGRNPDAIIRYRKENTAFIVDAKAYSKGYSLGLDDRAIREYINYYCPQLINNGYKKIGFIIVSNEFKSNFDSFINEMTWNTDIKRFFLMSSEALLYLLAYKTKDKLSLDVIIDKLIGFGNIIRKSEIIQEFDDI